MRTLLAASCLFASGLAGTIAVLDRLAFGHGGEIFGATAILLLIAGWRLGQ